VFQDPFDWGLNDFSTKSLTKSLVPVFCFLDQAKNGAANEIVTVIAAPIKAFQKTKENSYKRMIESAAPCEEKRLKELLRRWKVYRSRPSSHTTLCRPFKYFQRRVLGDRKGGSPSSLSDHAGERREIEIKKDENSCLDDLEKEKEKRSGRSRAVFLCLSFRCRFPVHLSKRALIRHPLSPTLVQTAHKTRE
jgi:hypothetical protein